MIFKSLSFRPALKKPLRLLMTILGVAAGTASITSTIISSKAAVASMEDGVRVISGRSSLEIVRDDGVEEQILAGLLPITRDALILPIIEEIVIEKSQKEIIRVLGIDPFIDRQSRDLYWDANINFENFITGNSIIISADYAEEMNLSIGDTLNLIVYSEVKEFDIAGTYKPGSVPLTWKYVVITDISLAQQIFKRGNKIDRIELVPRVEDDFKSIEEKIAKLLPPGYQVKSPESRVGTTKRMIGALRFNLIALSGVSLIVGGVLVATTLATSVFQRRSLIALLRSLGASQKQIARSILIESCTIGLIGGIVGVIFGYIGASLSLSSVRMTLSTVVQNAPQSQISITPGIIFLGITSGVLVSIIASLLPLNEAAKTPPLQNLRREKPQLMTLKLFRNYMSVVIVCWITSYLLILLPPIADMPIAAMLSALFLLISLLIIMAPLIETIARIGDMKLIRGLNIGFRLSAAALSATEKRAAWACGSIGVTVALAISITVMVDSFRQTILDWSKQSIQSAIWIQPVTGTNGMPIGKLNDEIIMIVTDLFGGEVVDPFHNEPFIYNDRPIKIAGAAFEVVARHAELPFLSGDDPKEVFAEAIEKNAVMINEPFMNRFGYSKGDRLQFKIGDKNFDREIVGVFYDYSENGGQIIMPREPFLDYFPNSPPQGIALFFDDKSNLENKREQIKQAIAGKYTLDILLNHELRQEVMKVFDQTFAITTSLQIVSSLIAVLAVLTVLFILVDERKQDLAILRSMGASQYQIGGMVVWEAGLLGFAGAVGGLVIGLVIGWVLVKIVNLQSFNWSLQFMPTWDQLFLIAFSVIPACIVAGLPPAIWAATKSPMNILREEE